MFVIMIIVQKLGLVYQDYNILFFPELAVACLFLFFFSVFSCVLSNSSQTFFYSHKSLSIIKHLSNSSV